MAREEKIQNIPDENTADEIADSFKQDGAHTVEKSQQPDGSWTVKADFD